MSEHAFNPAQILAHIRVLCKDIPPRQPTTEGDRKAAEYVHGVLTGLGIKSTVQPFNGISTLGLPAALSALLGLAGFPLGWYGGTYGKWLGGAIILLAGFTLRNLFSAIQPFFRELLERRQSRNVIGVVPPGGMIRKRIYLLGHLDAQKQRFLIPPSLPGTMRPVQTLTILLTLAAGISFWGEAAFGWPVMSLQIVSAAFLGIMLLLLLVDEFQPTVEGANDNASAVGILLSIADALATESLDHTEVHLLFTGCEEVGHQGLKAYLKDFNPPVEDSYWIDLELVGAGNLCYATRHGVTYLNLYRPGPRIRRLADETAEANPDLNVVGQDMLILEEVATLRMLGYEALCLMGYDENGYLPHWHRLSDNYDNLEPDTLQRAARFTWELMKRIDRSE
ncbi:MAG: M28 family peptidase [Chloroflexota bacterium]